MLISTHSLTKRLTIVCFYLKFFIGISTHSLTKRLTFSFSLKTSVSHISTHSLTKRLTGKTAGSGRTGKISTHSLTKRLTLPYFEMFKCVDISTHSLTKRLTFLFINSRNSCVYFNSQPHEEADGNFRQKYIYLKLFFTLIAHINLVLYSNHYIVNFFLVKYTHFLVRMS